MEDISVNIETAVPLGLIINELVSNSLKYAYPPDDTGDIFISLKKHDEEIEFILKDEGVGMPEDNSLKNSESGFGMELVNSLVQQLDAKMNLDRSQGTEFNIKFKELKYKKRI
ncbi:MAG: sensor histidine kinase [Methanobacterium sp.]|nr:sensor histidine kinase [Methanobacterium sp.]